MECSGRRPTGSVPPTTRCCASSATQRMQERTPTGRRDHRWRAQPQRPLHRSRKSVDQGTRESIDLRVRKIARPVCPPRGHKVGSPVRLLPQGAVSRTVAPRLEVVHVGIAAIHGGAGENDGLGVTIMSAPVNPRNLAPLRRSRAVALLDGPSAHGGLLKVSGFVLLLLLVSRTGAGRASGHFLTCLP